MGVVSHIRALGHANEALQHHGVMAVLQLKHLGRNVFGRVFGHGHMVRQTSQYALARILLSRLLRSSACRTTNASEAELFFVPVLAAWWALRQRPLARTGVVLAASYFFYMASSRPVDGSLPTPWYFAGLLAFSTVLDYVCSART